MAIWHAEIGGKYAVTERRRHVRYAGDGLMVLLHGRLLPAADVSVSGLRVADPGGSEKGSRVRVYMIPVVKNVLLMGMAVRAEGQVLGVGEAGLRLYFVAPPYSVAKLVLRHARRQCLNQAFSPSGR